MARISGSVTMGGADAFAIDTIQTALEGQTELAYSVKQITYEFDTTAVFTAAVAAQDVELAITRRTKAAMPAVTDVDIIKKWHWGSSIATAVGQIVMPELAGVWRPENETLIVEDPLYICIDSTATTLTLTGLVIIDYDIVRISAIDRLTLLTQSLV